MNKYLIRKRHRKRFYRLWRKWERYDAKKRFVIHTRWHIDDLKLKEDKGEILPIKEEELTNV